MADKPPYESDQRDRMLEKESDIKRRKKVDDSLSSDEILSERNEFADSLLNNSPNPLVVINLDTSVRYTNPAFERLTGFSSSEVIGIKAPYPWWTPEMLGKTAEDLKQAMRDGAERFEKIFQGKDGKRFWVEITSTPTKRNGKFQYYLSEWVDITQRKIVEEKLNKHRLQLENLIKERTAELVSTNERLREEVDERKRTEEDLRETRNYLENLINYANAPVIVWDPELRITRFNHAFERLTGKSADDVLGKPVDILFPEEGMDKAMAFIRQTLAEKRWESVEIPVERIDGEVRTIFWNSATLFEADGTKVFSVIAQGQDITENKKAEEALKGVNRALSALSKCNEALVRATNESDLLNDVCRIVVGIGGYRLVWVGLSEDDEKKSVKPVAYAGFEDGYLEGLDITWADTERGRGPTGTAIRTGKFYISRDIIKDSMMGLWRKDADRQGYRSSIALPLISGGRSFGALNIYAAVPEAFDKEEVGLLQDLSDDLAYGIISLRAKRAQRLAEEALRASEETARALLNATADAAILIDAGGKIFAINKHFAARVGKSPEECIGLNVHDFVAPDLAKSRKEFADQVFNTGEPVSFQDERDGLILGNNIYPVFDAHGNVDQVAIFSRDITSLVHAEASLRESEERLTLALDASNSGMWEFNPHTYTSILYNEKWFTMLGYEPDEFPHSAETWTKLMHPEDLFRVRKQLEEHINKKVPYNAEFRMQTKEGGYKWIHSAGKIVSWDNKGNPKRMIGIHVDINALKLSEYQVQQSKNMLQAVFDGISDPLIMVDKQLYVKMINRAAAKYYQVEFKDVLDKPCYEAFKERSGPCEGYEVPSAVSKGRQASFERERTFHSDRYEKVVVYPLKEPEDGREGAIIRISDISEAKLMEKQFIQSEKLASLGLLVAGIAHEINNPNNFILFNMPILKDYLEEVLPILDDYAADHPDFSVLGMDYPEFRKDIYKLLDNVEQGSRRITSTVSALNEFVRDSGHQEKGWFDLKQVVDKAVAISMGEIRKNVKSFEVNVPQDLPLFYTIPEALEQILVNLLINACHAVDKQDSWVELDVRLGDTRQDHLIIEVRDNGCGLDDKARQKVFDPFYTTKEPKKGTGLGLYVCQNLVTSIGGRIEVESEPAKGSTFRVILADIKGQEKTDD